MSHMYLPCEIPGTSAYFFSKLSTDTACIYVHVLDEICYFVIDAYSKHFKGNNSP